MLAARMVYPADRPRMIGQKVISILEAREGLRDGAVVLLSDSEIDSYLVRSAIRHHYGVEMGIPIRIRRKCAGNERIFVANARIPIDCNDPAKVQIHLVVQ